MKKSANPAELTNFFWHCFVASKMAGEQENTVIKAYRLHAVRRATDCWAGRNGVRYASTAAIAQRDAQGTGWDRCGLVKEHVIPVAVVNKLVQDEMKAIHSAPDAAEALALSGDEARGLTPQVCALFQQNPRASVVARIIRRWTLHAWITQEEDQRFDEKSRHGGISIRGCMPTGWKSGDDPFARYRACGIVVAEI